jgi:putative Mg2+ transporter-C (MgtC) family protein
MTLPSWSPDLEALLRLGMAVLCGLAVGLNRAHHGNLSHPNRVRVHVLVGLSACLMVLATGHGADARSRAIQGVAAGVGFLGAGEILVAPPQGRRQPPEVLGLSSAASIWFTAALGVTVAAARPALALVALVLALITLSDRRSAGGGLRPSNGPLGFGVRRPGPPTANAEAEGGDRAARGDRPGGGSDGAENGGAEKTKIK